MKAAGSILFCLVASGAWATEAAAMSDRLKAVIRADLPAYISPRDTAKGASAAGTSSDPDVLVLPKMTVRKKREQRFDPLEILSRNEQDKKYVAEYKASLKGLDAVLNGFTIPIIGQSLAARGRALHVRRQFEDLHFVSAVGAALDAESAAATKKAEAEMKRAIDWQNRPAGAK